MSERKYRYVESQGGFLAMKEAGITGFDLYEIGEFRQDTTLIPAGPAFMSDESLRLIKFVVKEAEKLDLTVGLSLSSSWNAGKLGQTQARRKIALLLKTKITGTAGTTDQTPIS